MSHSQGFKILIGCEWMMPSSAHEQSNETGGETE
jgi:hypothetical protein